MRPDLDPMSKRERDLWKLVWLMSALLGFYCGAKGWPV